MSEISDVVLREEKKGNVVFSDFEGYRAVGLDDFIGQSTKGLLYDLNRSPETVLTFIEDPKWVNDYAVGLVIKRLKEKNAELVEVLDMILKRLDNSPLNIILGYIEPQVFEEIQKAIGDNNV